ncbi:carboxyl transferase domain-containing protein [Parapusillimonas granuli]|uniref:Methylcrotonoyl-CoA carboxylase n=1 Tax=Parapusillimonas granuli TaxID=380911 RepID=A0A853FT16_9BURK|nr:carboxyl transferase domain-containing protein [Parapusillimonas granuli]MBB5214548.1 3-methylcrotonyl-CoA carboxylase beta subunit [Parapusillimonas granuli]MEB2398203.1 methylcrotonoyl-CoA carboxylase [Alcaligenaceae bacterium]NYT49044.1 methylcrotonoyl-CoA carboxylase [Parapusillimonas granuli]
MAILHSMLRNAGEDLERNRAAYESLRRQVQAAQAPSILGGGGRHAKTHVERGKLMPRDRINRLLDPGTPFLEVGQLAGHGLYEDDVPSGGLIVGIGMVAGRPCMAMANDATVKGGTYYPITIKKQIRAQAIARENGLPCIYLVDSGGAFLPLQEEIFPDEHHFGRIFRNIAEMSSLGIKQIAAVMGSCTAGGAYIPAMCDETVIVKGKGTIFLGGPQLVQAATGVVVDAETLGGADVHTRLSGVADHFADDDAHALAIIREIVARPGPKPFSPPPRTPAPPLYDPAELPGLIPANPKQPIPAREILARLMDGSELNTYRERYGPTLLCGTGAIGGYPVGVLINDGPLFSESAQKAANFIELCTQSDIPLLFLHNISGFMVGAEYEQGGIAKDGAKMVNAVSTSRVPKFSVIIGGSYGAGNFAMCGRAFGPRLMAMWPNARTSVMGGEQAATVLALVRQDQLARQGKALTAEEVEAFKQPIRDHYASHSTPVHAASRLWVDSVIDPVDTRQWLALGLALAHDGPRESTRFGVFRM